MVETTSLTSDLAVTAQPAVSDIEEFARRGFRTLVNNRPAGEDAEQMSPEDERVEAERLGLVYVHVPVKMGEITRNEVEAFRKAVEQSPKPVVAHCKSGARSYALWAAGEALSGQGDVHELADEAVASGYKLQALPDLVARLEKS